mmetsp:Transcript_6121/g.9839  ORF Transcript_6121/g.9839 Transcript_6121/m.9839 type:complete len:302 (+) Transcript_6121:500-1405(+)|eukprot:CAMPEP_0171509596 /NCGR_PEP_ID=MMETSP0958-20121227/14866_1 /TAXON_ID=87120 /ORGANISM="Aurantiochytrium limacinum, Strain ATCCMYA-1381" /LENGTH=301 /DNA_ID=CAMNT_0012046869 /DNA_START=424 /DNA_END=1329 /DNA_ORIENTATION=-
MTSVEHPCEAAAEAARALFFLHSSPALMPMSSKTFMQAPAFQLEDGESSRVLFSQVKISDKDEEEKTAAGSPLMQTRSRSKKAAAAAASTPMVDANNSSGLPPLRPRSRRIMLRQSQAAESSSSEDEEEEEMKEQDDDDEEMSGEDDCAAAETQSEPAELPSSAVPGTALAALLHLNRAITAVKPAARDDGHMESLLQGATLLADVGKFAARRERSSSVAVVEKRFTREAMPMQTKVGAYSIDERKKLIDKFLRKREKRIWRKRVKYNVRKNFADSRLRVKGRFVRKEDEEQLRELLVLSF